MPFVENFAEFTSTADFADAATFTPVGGDSKTVDGIFDADYVEPLGVESSGPVFQCAAADVDGVKHGDTLVVLGADYVVRGVQPDGNGWMVLKLAHAS